MTDYVPPEEIIQTVIVKRPNKHDRVLQVLFKFYDDNSIACEVIQGLELWTDENNIL